MRHAATDGQRGTHQSFWILGATTTGLLRSISSRPAFLQSKEHSCLSEYLWVEQNKPPQRQLKPGEGKGWGRGQAISPVTTLRHKVSVQILFQLQCDFGRQFQVFWFILGTRQLTSSTLSLQKQFHTGSRDRSGFVAKILLLKIHFCTQVLTSNSTVDTLQIQHQNGRISHEIKWHTARGIHPLSFTPSPTHLPVSPTFFLQTVHLFRFGVFCFSSNAGGSGPVTSVLPVASFSDTSREVATVRGKEEFTH